MCLILNLSLGSIMTGVGKFILFPFQGHIDIFPIYSITSKIIFLFNLKFSRVKCPVILNRCILPAVICNFTNT